MDTTAAAELGLADLDSGGGSGGGGGVAFWHSPPAGSDHWGNPGDSSLLDDDGDDDAWDRSALPVSVSPDIPPASPSGFARARTSTAEPPTKLLRSMPDGGGLGFSGHGAGPPSGRGHSSAGSPHFGGGGGGVGSSPSGAGAVGRGRGMGSIFYKTKLCSRFRSGNCPYNSNCNFAHGMEELRKPPPGWEEFVASQELPPPPSQSGGAGSSGAAAGPTDSQVRFHKTRPCKKYFGEGNCPYGEKCNFLHDEQSVPRAVREAREAAVAANSGGGVVAASPRVETPLAPANNDYLKETGAGGGSTSAGSAPPNARPSNWKTRLCNKWETTGHCPFGEKCHFAHGSDAETMADNVHKLGYEVYDACLPPCGPQHISHVSTELQRYGGGLPDPNLPALSDSKLGGTTSRDSIAVSWQQRNQGGASSARSGTKGNSTWRGPNDISTIYGDWWGENDYWQSGGPSASHESTELEADVWREAQRRTPLPAPPLSTPRTVPFFRRTNSLEPSRQTPESH